MVYVYIKILYSNTIDWNAMVEIFLSYALEAATGDMVYGNTPIRRVSLTQQDQVNLKCYNLMKQHVISYNNAFGSLRCES